MTVVWYIFTTIFICKVAISIYCLYANYKFFVNTSRPDVSIERHSDGGLPNIYIIIPLLNEQTRIPKIIDDFLNYSSGYDVFHLVLVTTQRETSEYGLNASETTCHAVSRHLDVQSNSAKDRIIHLHYPKENKVVADQHNFAVEHIGADNKKYFAFYNADSGFDDITYNALYLAACSGGAVFQQSSLFFKNTLELLLKKQALVAAFGLYQSGWTVQHEVSRYVIARAYVPRLPKWIDDHSLAHCVMHGLLVRSDILEHCGNVPSLSVGGEDLALGYVFRCMGYTIHPLSVLENSEMPSTFPSLWNQLSWWFVALCGYTSFHTLVPEDTDKANVRIQTLLGVYDMLKWAVKGWLVLAYLVLSFVSGHFAIGLELYLLYILLPLIFIWKMWPRLSVNTFAALRFSQIWLPLLLFPLVPIIRSATAISGAILLVGIKTGRINKKPKTE